MLLKVAEEFSADSRAGETAGRRDGLLVSWGCGKVTDTARTGKTETASIDVQHMVTIDALA